MRQPGIPTSALYVRLPLDEAHKLDRAALALRSPKKNLVSELVAHYVDPDTPEGLERLRELQGSHRLSPPLPRVLSDDDQGGPVVGHHEFRPAESLDVLTAAQAAGLLQVDEQAVLTLAEQGLLPGRRIGDQWRFARPALMTWLSQSGDADHAARD